jgi:hypothetical protein
MYYHVDYPRAFGESDVHTMMLVMSRQFGRHWGLRIGAGIFRTDFSGIRTVEVDPVIQELLGIRSGREAFNVINNFPAFSVSFLRNFRRSGFDVTVARLSSPGNGILLMNRNDTVTVNYRINTGDKWSYAFHYGFGQAKGFGVYYTSFRNSTVGSQANYRFAQDMHFTMGLDYRFTGIDHGTYSRNAVRVYGGVTYSPGAIPVAIR